MLGNLKVWVAVAYDSIKSVISTIKLEFEKLWNDLEKTTWNKVFKNLKKWSQETVQTISWLNKKLEELKWKLDVSAIWTKEFFKLQKQVEKTKKEIEKATKSASIFKNVMSTFGWIFAWLGIVQLWKNILTLGSNYEQTEVAFTTMLWSGEKAQKMLKDLSNFAAKTPFEVPGLRQTTKQLLAFGIEQEKIISTLKALGDVSSGLSVPIEQVAYAYWQVKVAWRLMWQDLMQFTNAWVPLVAELANMLGKSEKEIKKMVSAWQIGFPMVEEAFRRMSSEGWRFADMMFKQSNTLAGQWSNFLDQLTTIWEAIWLAIWPYIKAFIAVLSKLVELWVEWFKNLASWSKTTADVIQKNWDKILASFVAFWAVLAILNRKTIANFVKNGLKSMVVSLKAMKGPLKTAYASFLNLWKAVEKETKETEKNSKSILKNSKENLKNTKETSKNTLEKNKNTIATKKQEQANKKWTSAVVAQTKANKAASFSFKALWGNILGMVKRLIFMGLKFFAIAAIVVLVVTSIYKNWNYLKDKLKPIFEFIAKIWQKAPEIIATAFNWLVDIVFWAFEMILSGAKSLLNFLKKFWVNIDTSGIDNILKSSKDLKESLKITAEDVKWVFDSIWGFVGDAAESFTWLWWNVKDLASDFSDFWEDANSGSKKASEATKKLQKEVKKLESDYHSYEKKKEKLLDLEEKYAEKVVEFNENIKESISELNAKLDERKDKLETDLNDIENDKKSDLEKRYVDILQKEAEVQQELYDFATKADMQDDQRLENLEKINKQIEIQKKKISEVNGKTKESTREALRLQLEELENTKKKLEDWELSYEQAQKQAKLEKELLELQKEKELVEKNADKTKLDEAVEFSKLGKTAQILKQAELKKKEKEEEFELEKQKIEKQIKLNQWFADYQKKDFQFTLEDKAKIMETEIFKSLDKESQKLFFKLADEKMALDKQKNEKIKLENEIAEETIKLQNRVNEILKKNISSLEQEYQDLIKTIKSAITEQARLNSIRRSSGVWYAEGGYTWDWWKYEEAWVVHKWEYVIPQHMLKSMPDLMPSLEAIRTGQTPITTQNFHTNKSIDVGNITVQDRVDLELFFEKMKWKM